jgi:hypothetical protein
MVRGRMSNIIGVALEDSRVVYVTLSIGCWECAEQTEVLYAGPDRKVARSFLEQYASEVSFRHKIKKGASFPFKLANGEVTDSSCEEHIGRFELHRYETVLVGLTTTAIKPLRQDAFWVPDESGMGGEWSWPGHVYFDQDVHRWYVRVDKFLSRIASASEIEKAKAELADESLARASNDAVGPSKGSEEDGADVR